MKIKKFNELNEDVNTNSEILASAKDLKNILDKYLKNPNKVDILAVSMRVNILAKAIEMFK